MTEETEIPGAFEGFDNDLAIMLQRTFIEKWCELMLKEIDDIAVLKDWLSDSRLSAFVLGPGLGIGDKLHHALVIFIGQRSSTFCPREQKATRRVASGTGPRSGTARPRPDGTRPAATAHTRRAAGSPRWRCRRRGRSQA